MSTFRRGSAGFKDCYQRLIKKELVIPSLILLVVEEIEQPLLLEVLEVSAA